MKKFFLFIILAGIVAGANDSQAEKTREVTVAVNDAYIPGGFDSNTDAYAVVNGLFPNGCYALNRAETATLKDGFTHEVRTIASVSEGMCIMVLVPFTKEVSLGKLSTGEHAVRFVSGDGTYMEKKVVIE